jgi:hypothetical protein
MYTKLFRRKDLGNHKEDHPTAWQCLFTYGKFDEGDIGNSGLENQESP